MALALCKAVFIAAFPQVAGTVLPTHSPTAKPLSKYYADAHCAAMPRAKGAWNQPVSAAKLRYDMPAEKWPPKTSLSRRSFPHDLEP
jgi:hypothetical protein